MEKYKRIVNYSKEMLRWQIEAYRNLDQKSGIIVGIASLFLPLFITAVINTQI